MTARALGGVAAFLVAVSASPATISVVAVAGTDGYPGISGETPGDGGNGTAGDDAIATSITADSDSDNTVTATGGYGGWGGHGGDAFPLDVSDPAPIDGGSGGDGAYGGDAQAMASTTVAAGSASATSTALGGNGGTGGAGGEPWGAGNAGVDGVSASGGNATASAFAMAPGDVTVEATAGGGIGGNGAFSGAVGGDGGNATLGAVTGVSTGGGVVKVTGSVGGGSGGPPATPALANEGNGASATAINAVSGSTSGSLSLRQYAAGGDGKTGGDATSILSQSGSFGYLDVYVTSLGGSGLTASGTGLAAATGINLSGAATVGAEAAGGSAGGFAPYDRPGNGADGEAHAVAAGVGYSPSDVGSYAYSRAGGGWAGTTDGQFVGNAGAGTARAEATTTGSGVAIADADAVGGRGENRGGDATAISIASFSGDAGEADSTAIAEAGTNNAGGGAKAQADATANMTFSEAGGGYALARAKGGSGSATARTNVTGPAVPGGRIVATAPVLGTDTTTSITETTVLGNVGYGLSVFPRASDELLQGAALPDSARVEEATAGEARVTAALHGAADATTLLLGAFRAGYPGDASGASGVFSGDFDFSFDMNLVATPGTTLLVGLFDPIATGDGFDSLRLRIYREGDILLDQTLLDSASAVAFLDDRVLDLGDWSAAVSGDLDLRFVVDMSASNPADSFGFKFVTVSQVPVPPVAWLLLTPVPLLWRSRRRRSHAATPSGLGRTRD